MVDYNDGRPTQISLKFKIPDELVVGESDARDISSFLLTAFDWTFPVSL